MIQLLLRHSSFGNSHLLSFLWFVLELGCTQQLLIRSIANYINDSL